MENKRILFVEASDGEIKKLVDNSAQRNMKKSTKCRNDLCALASRNDAEGYKINKALSGLLVYLRVMPSTERLSSKFHNCPQIFASRQTVHQQSISLGH